VLRASVYSRGQRLVCTGAADILPSTSFHADTFEAFLKDDNEIGWCLHKLQVCNSQEVADSFREASVMVVSDGSYKDTFGTAAWILLAEDTGAYIQGCVLCPGAEADHSSYRSELAGIYSVLTVARKLCDFYNITEGCLKIGCDGLSAINTSLHTEPILTTDGSNFDLIAAIYTIRRALPIAVIPHFVKGHQDNTPDPLDIWAQLNVQMDALAKQHLQFAVNAPRHFSVLGEPWQFWVKGQKV
jgi:hypothetical protein